MTTRSDDAKPFTFLLVEDDLAHAELIKRGFEDQGTSYHLIHLSDGEAALDYLFRRGVYADAPRPGAVLLDLRLPRMSGFDVLQAVKATPGLRDVPIVILTTSKTREDALRAYGLHANSFIVKPTSFREFTALVDALSAYWGRWNFYIRDARPMTRSRDRLPPA
jgi:DNA-binding response OmpR family regulator